MYLKLLSILLLLFLSGCSSLRFESKTTNHSNDACKILKENSDWLDSTLATSKRWGVPISVQLSFIKQESSFKHNARPLKNNFFFFKTYRSSALGYAQALDGTWKDFSIETLNSNANRTSFRDSSYFIGWYIDKAHRELGLKKTDSRRLYLAYHDGINGYLKGTYKRKKWLQDVSKKVERQTAIYKRQIINCNF